MKQLSSYTIYLCFFIICQVTVLGTFAQTNRYKIIYRHCLQMDTTKVLADTMGREAVLIGDNNASSYVFAKLPGNLTPKPEGITMENILNEKKSGTNKYTIGSGKRFDTIGNIVYFDKTNDSIFVKEKMINDYVITKEKLPQMNWKISIESKIIQQYTCMKATCDFRGRSYIAWFTNEIPISEGPWKFKGLPGLILEMEDTKQQVKLYATEIEYPTKETVTRFVESGIPISLQKYMEYRNEEMHQQMKGVEAALQSQEHSDKVDLNTRVKTKIGLYGLEIRQN